MKSPFPGMDPYVEKHWRDIHGRLIPLVCDQLEEFLPPALVARIEERVVFEVDDVEHHRYPDLRVLERVIPTDDARGGTAVADADTAESYFLQIDSEPLTERFIEIIDVGTGGKVVTVVEFLSSTNKVPGDGLDQYLKKQQEMRQGKVSLVEVDLLRSGRRDLVMPVRQVPRKARSAYAAWVRRGWKPDEIEIFPIHLRRPVQKIKVPLRESDSEIFLDLQPLLEHAYRKGRYTDTIDYRRPPTPPLDDDDAKWADELLKAAGKR